MKHGRTRAHQTRGPGGGGRGVNPTKRPFPKPSHHLDPSSQKCQVHIKGKGYSISISIKWHGLDQQVDTPLAVKIKCDNQVNFYF